MSKKNNFAQDLYNFSVGFCMGGANVIPGVSGGTMLFIMGAFSKLTDAIAQIACIDTVKLLFTGKWKALYEKIQWRFLIGLGIGIFVSFATLAKLFVWLLAEYPQYTFSFFFGLITASIISVNRQMKKWTPGSWISFAVSTAVAYGVISLVPVNGSSQWYMLFIYGAICIIAMILPGLSGSFLLLIFGQYENVWNAVGNLAHLQWNRQDLKTLFFLAVGAIIGLGAFVHLLNYLLKKFYNPTIAALIGFMVGAIPRLWPYQHEEANRIVYDIPVVNKSFWGIMACLVAGLLLLLVIEIFASKKTTEE